MTQMIRRTVLARPAPRLRLAAFYALWRQRRALARLDDSALRDIGINRRDAATEAGRPFWDVPANWRD